jgi:16S rRNA (cytosine1402-N4)-methyltransferase
MQRLTPEEYHVPVMLKECLHYLQVVGTLVDGSRVDNHVETRVDGPPASPAADQVAGTLVDGTLGGGGHTKAILDHIGGGHRLVAFDADNVAIQRARERFADVPSDRLVLIHSNFGRMADELVERGLLPVSGLLLDLGVSSYQFDHHERGFSYRHDAPLDMRFGQEGRTAADVINTASEQELTQIIREYGEDPNAYKLAQAIVRRRALALYKTTFELRDTVTQHVPPQFQAKTLSRVFQALRIAVNDEIGTLERTLRSVIPLMAVGGRVVVMSYHSLEDRVVKDVFKEYSNLRVLTKKPVMASKAEVAANPRARSARLRAAEVVKA